MEITEVRIKLMDSTEDRLRGFCSITFDNCFVVRDLKIIEGNNGPFVAMPSRKLSAHCSKCRSKNHLRARYCNQCGNRLKSEQVEYDSGGRAKLYADIAHPVNAECREMIQQRVIEELEMEVERAAQPGYQSRYEDPDTDYYDPPEFPGATASAKNTDKGAGEAESSGTSRDPQHREDDDHPRLSGPHATPPAAADSKTSVSENSPSESSPEGEFGEGIFED